MVNSECRCRSNPLARTECCDIPPVLGAERDPDAFRAFLCSQVRSVRRGRLAGHLVAATLWEGVNESDKTHHFRRTNSPLRTEETIQMLLPLITIRKDV